MENVIKIIIGENVEVSNETNRIDLYVKNNNDIELYSSLKLPYLINHVEFLDIKDDPRYFLHEGYEKETKGCRYRLMLKPYGNLKGVYRILNGVNLHKVADIEETGIKLSRK